VAGANLGDVLSPEARDARLRSLAASGGGTVETVGHSVQGRPLLAARLPSRGGPHAPKVLCAANIHGVEFVATRVALAALELAVNSQALLGRAELWVWPSINPDGYARTFEQDGQGTLAALRTNAHGVDLNRNFPRPFQAPISRLPFTGSSRHGDATYRGPDALSEPETQAVATLCAQQKFHAVLSLHSFMGTLIPARVLERQHAQGYVQLCEAFFSAQPRWRYRRVQSQLVDAFTGELEDHLHHALDAWACCVESFPVSHSVAQHLHAPSLFWRFNPRNLDAYLANDVPGVLAFFDAALSKQRPGAGQPGRP